MKQITPEEALMRLKKLCSVCEKCIHDIRQKLIEYKTETSKIDVIIKKLQNEGFVDDCRFACFFARTKHNISKWGKQKIEYQLRTKQIPETVIAKALNEIPDELYGKTISDELVKKLKTIKTKATSQSELVAKLMKFALSRGYDSSVSYEIIKNMVYKQSPANNDLD
ncbi:MAG: RecX family transcriptional regulator [Prevotellaceae bacterium]|jgi:regulatory protein|nr:RecX family transcriptional regulator [Prevotellaceae bacterium]